MATPSRSRLFRATVFLPGRGEGGRLIPAATVSAKTQAGLEQALKRWKDQGYEYRAWEEVPLEFDTGTVDPYA